MRTDTLHPITSDVVCEAAGCSYRQLDYWTRLGLVEPLGRAHPGSGHPRVFSRREVRVAAVVAALMAVGATERTLANVAPLVRAMSDAEWHGTMLVSRSGVIARAVPGRSTFGEACWVINLDLLRTRSNVDLVDD
jgi:hypothetical protein